MMWSQLSSETTGRAVKDRQREAFEPSRINGMELKNRFVRSGIWTGMATEDGLMTDKLKGFIAHTARGGTGLVVPDYMPVHRNGQSAAGQPGLYDDSQIEGLAGLTDEIHKTGSKIIAQLDHGGAHARPDLTGVESRGPSAIPRTTGASGEFAGCKEMSRKDINTVVESFGKAAARAKQAGFDGVQIDCSHGHLLSEFLSPFYNKRNDAYGGAITNRSRITVDAYNQVRRAVGDAFPVLVKMNVTDFLDGGLTDEDALAAAGIFSDIGADAIELSGGTDWGLHIMGDMNRTSLRTEKKEGYYRDIAKEMKARFDTPVILTGGIRSYHTAYHLLQDNAADYIGLRRPLIHEPELINRWASGDLSESTCVSCNGCSTAAMAGKGLQCAHANS